MTRYIDSPRCNLIAEALEYLRTMKRGEMTRDRLEVLDQMESLFRDRAEPNAGFIMTIPGETE
jgi:hypothetical protein